MSFFVFENKNDEKGHLSVAKGLGELYVHIFSSLIYILCESWLAVKHGCEKN